MSCAVVLLVGVQWIGFTHPWLISTLNIDLLWLLLPLLCCGTLEASLRPICLLLLVLTIGLFAQSGSLGKDPECFDHCALVGTIIGVKSLADLNQISLSVASVRLGEQVTRLEPLRVRASSEAKTRKVGESITGGSVNNAHLEREFLSSNLVWSSVCAQLGGCKAYSH